VPHRVVLFLLARVARKNMRPERSFKKEREKEREEEKKGKKNFYTPSPRLSVRLLYRKTCGSVLCKSPGQKSNEAARNRRSSHRTKRYFS